MISGSWSIRELLAWARWGRVNERGYQIDNFLSWRWQEDISDFQHILDELDRYCHPEISYKVKLSCFLSCLINKSQINDGIPLYIYKTTPYLHKEFGLAFDELWNMNWSVACWIGITKDSQAEEENIGIIGNAVVGVSHCSKSFSTVIPETILSIIDEEARESLNEVLDLIKRRFKYGSMLIQILPKRPIHGGSFSLSIYSAFRNAVTGKRLHHKVALSGRIKKDGTILPPGNLDRKTGVLRQNDFRGFIYGSNRGFHVKKLGKLECIGVGTLDDFEFLMEYYEPGHASEIHKFHEIIGTPESFATRLHHLDERIVRSSWFDKSCQELIPRILEDPERADEFSTSLEKFIGKFSEAYGLTAKLLKSIEKNSVEKLGNKNPLSAWNIAIHCSAFSAREGNFEEAKKWEKIAENSIEKITKSFGLIERRAELYNRELVTSFHLTFTFSPEPPPAFLSALQLLEKLHEELSLPPGPTLGKMYGTLAQHYGFCGPDYLRKVEHYVEKAQKAFGDGKTSALYHDWNRQWNYLVYAYLDACKYDSAERALKNYLCAENLSSVTAISKNWNSFHHAAFARFVADTRKYIDTFLKIKSDQMEKIASCGHPWQLWAFNLGRVLKDRRQKLEAWEISYSIANSLKGPARAFALLPLSAMFVEGLKREEELISELEKIKTHIISCKGLNQKHFEPLWTMDDGRNVLEKVWNERHIFFPFTYR